MSRKQVQIAIDGAAGSFDKLYSYLKGCIKLYSPYCREITGQARAYCNGEKRCGKHLKGRSRAYIPEQIPRNSV